MNRPFNIDKLRDVISRAFEGVGLDGGASLQQLQVMDNYGEDENGQLMSARKFRALYESDESKNWRAIPAYRLREDIPFAHANAKCFRFYIPALLLNWLAEGDNEVASYALCRKEYDEYVQSQYSLLNEQQRAAIAIFLEYAPLYVEVDERMFRRALDNYWGQFLPPEMKLD